MSIRINTYTKDAHEWSTFLTIPELNYIDYGYEPIPLIEVKSIDIQIFFLKKVGERIPIQKIDLKDEIIDFINSIDLKYEFIAEEEYVRVYMNGQYPKLV